MSNPPYPYTWVKFLDVQLSGIDIAIYFSCRGYQIISFHDQAIQHAEYLFKGLYFYGNASNTGGK